ncbi:MAG: hypothetical protein IJ600_05005 [Lachnospiraceae bacterium]|nr:hypothetical protein [Lachnospiraceae bacterium]
MSKKIKWILNILIAIAVVGLLLSLIHLGIAIKYAGREREDPVETYAGVFEYELKHKAYGEVMQDYFVKRLYYYTAPAGYEDLYRVGEYAHSAFMYRIYAQEEGSAKAAACSERMAALRSELGDYAYTADEIDEMIRTAP